MKRLLSSLLCATVLSLSLVPAVQAQEGAALDAAMEKYIMEHPKVILDSINKYRNRDKISGVEEEKLKNNVNSPVIGNKNGDVTLVEFFDYHCGYCKRFFTTIAKLVEEDSNLKVVFKELPIISEDSEIATRASLAVYNIDPTKYYAFHAALMKINGRFDVEKMVSLAKQAGLDETTFIDAMKSEKVSQEIAETKELAESLGVSGTPVVVIGKSMIPGAVDIDTVRAKIAFARQAAKSGK